MINAGWYKALIAILATAALIAPIAAEAKRM